MDAGFCVDCLEEAIKAYGTPEIFNSDQGSQFTSDAFTGVLIEHGVTISMDGRGRALDNIFVERLWRTVKYEEVYLKQHGSLQELLMGLTRYFMFYNQERQHQSLGYETPEVVYLYKYRHLVENVFARLKYFRAIATRYDKLKRNFEGAVALACAFLWLPM